MFVFLTGLSYRSAPLAVRETLSIAVDRLPSALATLERHAGRGVILSTCNRTEVYSVVRDAEHGYAAFDSFVADFEAKYENAVRCLTKDRDVLLTFYDFPAEHWKHLRTTNPIESTFATVRLRHRRTKGNGSRAACLAMVFRLVQSAEKRWRRLNGHQLIPDVIRGVRFIDGIKLEVAA